MELPKETIVWKNKEEATMTIVRKSDVKKDGEVIGSTEEKSIANVTLDDLEKGIETVAERLMKNKKEKDKLNEKLKALGKVPAKTAELVRLKKNLDAMNAIAQSEKLKAQIEELDEQMTVDSTFIDKRRELIASKPKD